MVKRKPATVRRPSARSVDQPATRKMLWLVRGELKSRFDSHDTRFDSIEAKLGSHDARFTSIDKRFDSLELKLVELEKRWDARLSRMELLLEEQNANNRIVLEGLQALWQRIDRAEARLEAAKL